MLLYFFISIKNFISAIALAALFISCSKKEVESASKDLDSVKITDSINAVRTKINDSIRAKNSKNRFKDFSGNHKFTHNLIKKPGNIDFKQVNGERDHYTVSGSILSGKNSVKIRGFMVVVSDKYMNFTGEITQNIVENNNGKPYIRKGTKTFMSKDGGKTWKLQDMVNGSGFVDHIDIHF